jgi:ribonuclease E
MADLQGSAEIEPGAQDTRPPAEGGEPRRRRRRGRRGGRRNRRDRFEPEQGGMAGETGAREMPQTAAPDPYRSITEPRPEPPFAAPAAPAAAEPAAPAAEPEAPKRRSTVREPAPFVRFDEGSAPAPVPMQRSVPLAPASEAGQTEEDTDPNRPRRSGWWQKR